MYSITYDGYWQRITRTFFCYERACTWLRQVGMAHLIPRIEVK